ncbi:hypothetical protein NW752_002413 [Fusarium irregulare]|nr:hypothetical protein NW752_002413 [Fusarium irregulare]
MGEGTSLNISLHELSVRNPWFATHPLLWTERHLQLVNCTIQQLDAPPEAGKHQENTVDEVEEFADEWHCPTMKGCYFSEIFSRDGNPLEFADDAPSFYYAQHEINRPDCIVFLEPTPPPSHSSTARLVVGFCSYALITVRRRAKCYPWWQKMGMEASRQRSERKLRQCTPKTWTQDPYLVCIMLSLAQNQWLEYRCQSYPVCLIVCNETDKANAYVYHAEFPLDVMDGLKIPSSRIVTWPTIYYTKIAFEPYGTFIDRLTTNILGAKEVKTSTAESTKNRQHCGGSDST